MNKNNLINFIDAHSLKLCAIEYLLYYSKQVKPEVLIVSFASMERSNYSRVSWFEPYYKRDSKYAFLFLCDPSNLYYTKDEETIVNYEKIIYKAIRETIGFQNRSNAFLVGNSMGASAALYYGIKLHLGNLLLGNPQFDFESLLAHNSSTWYKAMKSSGFSEIKDIIYSNHNVPNLYIEYSDYLPDFTAAESLINIWNKKNACCSFKKIETKDHEIKSPSADTIMAYIQLWKNDSM
jgi:predicted esterase